MKGDECSRSGYLRGMIDTHQAARDFATSPELERYREKWGHLITTKFVQRKNLVEWSILTADKASRARAKVQVAFSPEEWWVAEDMGVHAKGHHGPKSHEHIRVFLNHKANEIDWVRGGNGELVKALVGQGRK